LSETTTAVDAQHGDPFVGIGLKDRCSTGLVRGSDGRLYCHQVVRLTTASQVSDALGMFDGALVIMCAALAFMLKRRRDAVG
jgi:hypothetical protein